MIIFALSFLAAALVDNAYGYLLVAAAMLFYSGMRFERDRADGLLTRWPVDDDRGRWQRLEEPAVRRRL